ncbi:MAG: penicillin-binding protein 2 [Burkholderiales bacterium]|nr:penicillin-binding protein 2 [Burkholderiales bacterium]
MSAPHPALALRLKPWRSTVILGLFSAAALGLVARAGWLASVQNDFLQAQADRRVQTAQDIPAHRGKIVDRRGALLAVSVPLVSITADPRHLTLKPGQLEALAKALEMPSERLQAQLADTRQGFVYLRRHLTDEQADRVRALRIAGLGFETDFRRFYPAAEEAGHLVGFTGRDASRNDVGRAGIERAFDRDLGGIDGKRVGLRNSRGQWVDDARSVLPPQHGRDLALAIDRDLQYLAYRELREAVLRNKARGGGIVMLDVHSGEVLAMANYPAYNPNNDERADPDRTRNRTVIDLYEPGSTMKPFTAAMALEEGIVEPDTRIDVGDGSYRIGKHTIKDTHPKSRFMTVTEIIQQSSNVGSLKMALQVQPSRHWEYLHRFGFGVPPGTGFPGEATGMLRPWKTWKPVDQVVMSYGNGVAVSLLQMARAYLVFARDGDMIPIRLTRETDAPQGERVISSETAHQVRAMLEMVTQDGGTAKAAAIPGYRVAGKTGTARKIREGGGYGKSYIASFVGFAPASAPRYVLAVMVDEPGAGAIYGGAVAAPVFGKVMGEALRLHGVPRDRVDPVWVDNRPAPPPAQPAAPQAAVQVAADDPSRHGTSAKGPPR